MSLRGRVAWIVGITVAVLLVALGATLQVQTARTLVGAVDDDLAAIARAIERDPRGLFVVNLPGRDRFGGASGIVQLVGSDGEIVVARRPGTEPDDGRVRLPVDEAVLAVARGTSPRSLTTVTLALAEEEVRLRMLTVQAGDRFALQVARPIDEVEAVITALRWRTALATLVGALFAALIAWTIAGRSIRPVSALTASVEQVRDGRDLTRRIAPPDGDDEVARLARAFDAMLGRLEASHAAQERLASDASHELRTPLTSLRTNVEVLARDAERLDPADRQRLTEDVIGQLDELTAMVDGLVTVTRVESSAAHLPVDVVAVVADTVAAARRRHPQRARDLVVEHAFASVEVTGDARALALAVSALLDNAVKYAPSGPIVVRTAVDESTPRSVRISVSDTGPGVEPAAVGRLFERFYRTEDARGLPGSGLGLALVARVAGAHGGQASARLVAPHGLEVSVVIPAL